MGIGNELSSELYKRSDVYVENIDVTKAEMPNLVTVGELGQLELGKLKKDKNPARITIFQSRGELEYNLFAFVPKIRGSRPIYGRCSGCCG